MLILKFQQVELVPTNMLWVMDGWALIRPVFTCLKRKSQLYRSAAISGVLFSIKSSSQRTQLQWGAHLKDEMEGSKDDTSGNGPMNLWN